MSLRHERLWWSVSTAALVGLIVTMSALGQNPAELQPSAETKSTSNTEVKPGDVTNADGKAKTKGAPEAATKTEQDWRRVTDQEWQRLLTRNQYLVTRRKETEPPFSGKYATSHAAGTFLCVCCKAELFSSRQKFDSGTGWPSFWQPIDVRALAQAPDYAEAEPRVEVMCRRCGAHLGHVFDDGPDPTGLRFCINSLSLDFKPSSGVSTAAKAKSKAKVKAKAKAGKSKVAPRTSESKSGDTTSDSGS